MGRLPDVFAAIYPQELTGVEFSCSGLTSTRAISLGYSFEFRSKKFVIGIQTTPLKIIKRPSENPKGENNSRYHLGSRFAHTKPPLKLSSIVLTRRAKSRHINGCHSSQPNRKTFSVKLKDVFAEISRAPLIMPATFCSVR